MKYKPPRSVAIFLWQFFDRPGGSWPLWGPPRICYRWTQPSIAYNSAAVHPQNLSCPPPPPKKKRVPDPHLLIATYHFLIPRTYVDNKTIYKWYRSNLGQGSSQSEGEAQPANYSIFNIKYDKHGFPILIPFFLILAHLRYCYQNDEFWRISTSACPSCLDQSEPGVGHMKRSLNSCSNVSLYPVKNIFQLKCFYFKPKCRFANLNSVLNLTKKFFVGRRNMAKYVCVSRILLSVLLQISLSIFQRPYKDTKFFFYVYNISQESKCQALGFHGNGFRVLQKLSNKVRFVEVSKVEQNTLSFWFKPLQSQLFCFRITS